MYMGEEDEDGRRIDGKVWSVRVGRLLRYKSIIVQQAKVAKRSSKSRTILYIKQIFYHIIVVVAAIVCDGSEREKSMLLILYFKGDIL